MQGLVAVVGTGRRRRVIAGLAGLVVIAVALLVHIDQQHRFGLRTETFSFESGGNTLAATLHLPDDGRGPHGIVVFVPGDGTSDADPGALPVWEALANAGYATVKWDKPGVRGSTGSWLDQDMGDRADEVVDALAALAPRDDLTVDDVGVMGLSQGGWVIPLVASRTDVDFFVAWSTAIDWVEQGRYLTERALADVDAPAELAARVRRADRQDRGDTYAQYLAWHDALDNDTRAFFDRLSEERWQFVVRNRDLDARDTLPAMRDTPVLLLLGGGG